MDGAFTMGAPRGAFLTEDEDDVIVTRPVEHHRPHPRYRGVPRPSPAETFFDYIPQSPRNVARAVGAGVGQLTDFVSGGAFGDYAAEKRGQPVEEWREDMRSARAEDPAATFFGDTLAMGAVGGPVGVAAGKLAKGAFDVFRAAPRTTGLAVMSGTASEAGEPSAFTVRVNNAVERRKRIEAEIEKAREALSGTGAGKPVTEADLPERLRVSIDEDAIAKAKEKPKVASKAIEDLQSKLQETAGFDPGKIDGLLGKKTLKAIARLRAARDAEMAKLRAQSSSNPQAAALQKRIEELQGELGEVEKIEQSARDRQAKDLREKELRNEALWDVGMYAGGGAAGVGLGAYKGFRAVKNYNDALAKRMGAFNQTGRSIPVDDAGEVITTAPGALRGKVEDAYGHLGQPTPFDVDGAGRLYQRGLIGSGRDLVVGNKPTRPMLRSVPDDDYALGKTDLLALGIPGAAVVGNTMYAKPQIKAEIDRLQGELRRDDLSEDDRDYAMRQLQLMKTLERGSNFLTGFEAGMIPSYPVTRWGIYKTKQPNDFVDPTASSRIKAAENEVKRIDAAQLRTDARNATATETRRRNQLMAQRRQDQVFDREMKERDLDLKRLERDFELETITKKAEIENGRGAFGGRAQGTQQGDIDPAGPQGAELGRPAEGPRKDTNYSAAVRRKIREDAGILADQGKFSLYVTDDAMEVIKDMGKRVPRQRVNEYLDNTRSYIRRYKERNPNATIDAEFIRKMPKEWRGKPLLSAAAVAGTGATAAVSLSAEKANAQPRDEQGNFRPMTNREKKAFERKLKRLRGELEGRD